MSIETRTPEEPHATDQQIEGIVKEVWAAFTGISIKPAAAGCHPAAGTADVLTGTVHVDGQWRGRIQVTCAISLAAAAASAMFAKPTDGLSAEDLADALGELTNMIGGNIKSLLPSPSRISMPSVTTGSDTAVAPPGADQTNSITLTSPRGRLHVTVCHLQDRHRKTGAVSPNS